MNKIGWIIYQREDAAKNLAYIQWFIDECRRQQINLLLVYREELQIGVRDGKLSVQLNSEDGKPPHFAVIRTIEPLLNQHLEQMGVPVFNSSETSILCNNKAITHQTLTQLDIPMVHTLFLNKALLPDHPPLSMPFVVKSVSGRGGKQVKMIRTATDWQQAKVQFSSDHVIVQTCDVQLGKDLRVFIVGKEIVGAVLRESNTNFRANYTLGGTAIWYQLNDSETKLVQSIVDYFDFGMVGIDFLIDHDGSLLFNEIEDIVGSRTLSEVSDVNIVEKYVTLINERTSM